MKFKELNVVEINGTEFYGEMDILKSYTSLGAFGQSDDVFLYENFDCQQIGADLIGLVSNSIPAYCRYGKNPNGMLLKNCSMQKDATQWNEQFPKCGWGIIAFLAVHTVMREKYGLIYSTAGDECSKEDVFSLYFDRCRSIYEFQHSADYRHYEAVNDTRGIEKLDKDFINEHVETEKKLLRQTQSLRTNSVDVLFFGGRLQSVANDYYSYIPFVGCGKGKHNEGGNSFLLTQLIGKDDACELIPLLEGMNTRSLAKWYMDKDCKRRGITMAEFHKAVKRLVPNNKKIAKYSAFTYNVK